MDKMRKALSVAALSVLLGGTAVVAMEHEQNVVPAPVQMQNDGGAAFTPVVEHDRSQANAPVVEHDTNRAYLPVVEHDRSQAYAPVVEHDVNRA
jgi:hypothetical protein